MRVCVIGGDGRAHALARTLGRHHRVVVTPGNPGIAESVPTDPSGLDADLFVISPEAPLVDGLADRLRGQGKVVYGPGADGARLEGSKAWMKEVVDAAGVPTASHAAFDDADAAIDHLRSSSGPWVVKTDGLAAGKGVLVTTDLAAAEKDVRAKVSGSAFGEAGRTVVIEDFLVGPELSILAVCDGTRAVALAPAQDAKRLFDGDRGPNTGGMGAFSPVPGIADDVVDDVLRRFVEPTLAELRRRGIDYRGTLYAGLVLTDVGPQLLEYNVRFGDPEAQAVLPRLTSDLGQLLHEAATGELRSVPTFTDDACVTVACATAGYPLDPATGDPIHGLDSLGGEVEVFFAGVGSVDGRLVTAGGRVLYVTALGSDLAQARKRAYDAVTRISWDGLHHRSDIAGAATQRS